MVAKSTAKKPVKKVTKKTPAATKATVAAKKPVARKKTPSKAVAAKAEMKSFKVYRDGNSFKQFKISRQTVYWVILLLVIISLQLWVISMQLQIADQTNVLLSE